MILPQSNDIDLEHCPSIGKGFCLIHGHGTTINRFSEIGQNCIIYHDVTIGSLANTYPPKIGDNVYITWSN